MTKVSILLDTKTRDLMKSVARKEQTYSDFILELIEHKAICTRNNVHRIDTKMDDKKHSVERSPQSTKSQGYVYAAPSKGGPQG